MTREEAIKILTKINTNWVDRPKEQTEALDMAIEALEEQNNEVVFLKYKIEKREEEIKELKYKLNWCQKTH